MNRGSKSHLKRLYEEILIKPFVDNVFLYKGWRESNNRIRVFTGFMTGATALSFLWVSINRLVLKLR